MTPTPEQQAILDAHVPPGTALKIIAYAGTGKTSTLCALAEKFPTEEILYLAFNKSVEADAVMRFPCNTTAKTGHALAYRHVGAKYRISNLQNWQLAKIYGLSIYEASLLLRSYENFLCSADPIPDEPHILPDRLNKLSPTSYVGGMIDQVNHLFADMVNEKNGVPMTHSGYLKVFQLQRPRLGFPIVLLDEAQDTNPVMHRIVLDQAESGSRVYLVGDPYQQIYGWRGAVDAMTKIEAPEFRLTQSFRFGPAIAGVGSKLLNTFFGEEIPLRGLDAIPSTIGRLVSNEHHTILCRTNSGLVRNAYASALGGAMCHVVGEQAFQQTLESVSQIYLLYSGKRGLITEKRLLFHSSFAHLREYAEESMDVELMSKARMVEEYGAQWPEVRQKIQDSLTTEVKANVLLSTVHKAKGLEWDKVRLSDGFEDLYFGKPKWEGDDAHSEPQLRVAVKTSPNDESEISAEEVNLLYVSATRAKQRLQLTHDLTKLMNHHETPTLTPTTPLSV